MIITCKECKAVYCIAEKIIGQNSKMVKCTRCQHTWMVSNDAPSSLKKPCKTSSKANAFISALLLLIIASISILLFPEFLIRFQPVKNIYEKCGIYDSKGLLLDNISFTLNANEILIKGLISNNSLNTKAVPDIRYILLNKDKKIIFQYTHRSSKQLLKPAEVFPINSKIININDDATALWLDIGNKLELLLK